MDDTLMSRLAHAVDALKDAMAEIHTLREECGADQRNAAKSQREAAEMLDVLSGVFNQYSLEVTVDGEKWISDGCMSTLENIADRLVRAGQLTKHTERRLYRWKV